MKLSKRALEASALPARFLFDTHCHIGIEAFQARLSQYGNNSAYAPFENKVTKQTCMNDVELAIEHGIGRLVIVGTDAKRSEKARNVANYVNNVSKHSMLEAFWCAGIHPHFAHLLSEEWPKFEELVRHKINNEASEKPLLVGIGETGMDFRKSIGTEEQQRAALCKHLELAEELDLPIIIHSREADKQLYSVLKDAAGKSGRLKGVIHCFSSTPDWMEKYLALGMYISFSGMMTYPRLKELRRACRECPLDRIVIETDSPFLSPQVHRGMRNTPAYVQYVFESVCNCRGIPSLPPNESLSSPTCQHIQKLRGELLTFLWENSAKLFQIVH